MESLLIDLMLCLPAAVLCVWKAKLVSPDPDPLERGQTTALKGAAALFVLLHHLAQRICAGGVFLRLRGVGYLCVAVFFFLSGYGLMKQNLARADYRNGFLRRRALPILLPYVLVTLLCAGANAWAGTPYSAQDLLGTLLIGDPIVPFSWYVVCILLFYPVFALGMRLSGGRPGRLIAICSAYIAVYIAAACFAGYGSYWYNTVHLLPLGMLFAVFQTRITAFLRKLYPAAALLLWAAFFMLYPVCDRLMAEQYGSLLCTVTAMLTAAVFLTALILMLMKVRIVNPCLTYLGQHAYEIYLFQGLFMILLRSDVLYLSRDLVFCIAVIAGTLVFSHLFRLINRRTAVIISHRQK